MKKYLLLIILNYAFADIADAQKQPIKISYQYLKENDFDNIKLIVENVSFTKTVYYSIGVEGLIDTGWIGLNADINSLGMNEFWALKPIKPKSKAGKYVSKKKIFNLYRVKKITQIRFGVTFFEKKNFDSKSITIYLPPMSL